MLLHIRKGYFSSMGFLHHILERGTIRNEMYGHDTMGGMLVSNKNLGQWLSRACLTSLSIDSSISVVVARWLAESL